MQSTKQPKNVMPTKHDYIYKSAFARPRVLETGYPVKPDPRKAPHPRGRRWGRAKSLVLSEDDLARIRERAEQNKAANGD